MNKTQCVRILCAQSIGMPTGDADASSSGSVHALVKMDYANVLRTLAMRPDGDTLLYDAMRVAQATRARLWTHLGMTSLLTRGVLYRSGCVLGGDARAPSKIWLAEGLRLACGANPFQTELKKNFRLTRTFQKTYWDARLKEHVTSPDPTFGFFVRPLADCRERHVMHGARIVYFMPEDDFQDPHRQTGTADQFREAVPLYQTIGTYGSELIFEITRGVRLLDLTSEDTGRWLWNAGHRDLVVAYVMGSTLAHTPYVDFDLFTHVHPYCNRVDQDEGTGAILRGVLRVLDGSFDGIYSMNMTSTVDITLADPKSCLTFVETMTTPPPIPVPGIPTVEQFRARAAHAPHPNGVPAACYSGET